MVAVHRGDGLIIVPPPTRIRGQADHLRTGHRTAAVPGADHPRRDPHAYPAARPQHDHESKRRNESIARYHNLGYKTLVGAKTRSAVHYRDGWPLAMLGSSTAAWKLAPGDRFIGWTPQLREKNLPVVVDNPSFLVLT